ncbi:TetR family transcriptional regulator [Actinomadura sp. WAC 06369]|uniref:TetR family transcriptional regulator n=1 Tax=Actinomadura sp. WAC 06369 TaxID=2203193 RepID=UPI000F78ABCF|nr:TetR family transcriptional regulator [Actinomadura sp. WAC 06369]RSN54668.1 TetR/AcrR family transcriptional regulator [Actinomadura sp. WAC 06369]
MASTDSTRDRIVAAAGAEFAGHGIAGARVDRIARAAQTSKERVYAYFRSKEKLYAFVAARELAAAADAVHLDPADLPAYAGQLFDYFAAHPDRYRFIAWGRLELTGDVSDDPASALYRDAIRCKVERIRGAQEAGDLDASWDPVDVLALVSQIAHTWLDQGELSAVARCAAADPAPSARRDAVVRAVAAIFPPRAGKGS